MKPGLNADYPIQVYPLSWDEAPAVAPLYDGVFGMILNFLVEIVFVPDVSAAAPPWDGHQLPANVDEVSTAEQARLAAALVANYAVTPNEARAGEVERFRWPADEGARADVVMRYVSPAEFARYSADLDHLSTIVSGTQSETPVSELRDYEVVRFVEREVVAAAWLQPGHAAMLGRGGVDGPS
jgi:hypothetical protein